MTALDIAKKERDILAADLAAREDAGETIPLNDFLIMEDANRAYFLAFFNTLAGRN